jgi:hypothetical protein
MSAFRSLVMRYGIYLFKPSVDTYKQFRVRWRWMEYLF